MVLTQFELKSWSNNDDTTSMDTNFLYNSTTQCLEQQRNVNPQLFGISSSNGYYGFQPVTTSMKQENLIINDCDMSSMHCDNIVQENNINGGDSDMQSKYKENNNNQQILTYLGHESQLEIHQRCAVFNSSQRKRRYDTNYELKQCSKKLRQEGCNLQKQNVLTDNDLYLDDELLYNIHGSSSYHWIRASSVDLINS